LQGSTRKADYKTTSLGPDESLLRQKRREKEAQRSNHSSSSHKKDRRSRMTPAEKEEVVRQMQYNASRRDHDRHESIHNKTHEKHDVKRNDIRPTGAFLNEFASRAHGIERNSVSMATRVARNRHSNQRSHDSHNY